MSGASIYIVADEAGLAVELRDRLSTLGYRVVGVSASGEEALERIASEEPDLVLLDIDLAGAGPSDERELHATLQVAHYKRQAERERRRRLDERDALAARLIQAQKAESLGRMAAALAQSCGNASGAILGFIELARASLDHPAACDANLVEAVAEVRRVAELSRALRQYAHGEVVRPSEIDLGWLCRERRTLLEALLPQGIHLTFELPPEGPRVHADAGLVCDVLVQLVANAGEAMSPRGGVITVGAGTIAAEALRSWRLWPAGWASTDPVYGCLSVRDQGAGIPEAELDRVFDPFFSTKSLGRGLGLSLVLAHARALSGAVGVATGPRGSTLSVVLPLTATKGG